MVTPQGFNALLKLVEEPPEHVKFVFATTEPERVIGTIRSRTHHYPFRLVPGETMLPFLHELCDHESIAVGEGVLPLVVRAGGGSVRDSLSVLDQLMAGSIDARIDYDHAIALLGYTDSALLDDTIESLGVHDGAHIFATIERMVESGHDPRRFVEDLLQRLRDLLIIAVAGEQSRDILGEVPHDQLERMAAQAKLWGPKALSQAAELTDEALRQMVGATSPRLQLELLVGRILIETQQDSAVESAPAGTDSESTPVIVGDDGKPLTGAALAREELRRIREAQSKKDSSSPHKSEEKHPEPVPRTPAVSDAQPTERKVEESQSVKAKVEEAGPVQQVVDKRVSKTPASDTSSEQVAEPARSEAEYIEKPSEPVSPAAPVEAAPISASAPQVPTDVTANLHGKWDQFIDAVNQLRRASRFLLAEHATIVSEDAESVTFGFVSENLRNAFYAGGHDQVAVEAIRIVIGSAKQVHTTVGDSPAGQQSPASAQQPASAGTPAPQPTPPEPTAAARTTEPQPPSDDGWGPVAVPGGGLNQNLDANTPQGSPAGSTNAAPPVPIQPAQQSTASTPENHQPYSEPGLRETEVASVPDEPQYVPDSPDEPAEELVRSIAEDAPDSPPIQLDVPQTPDDFDDPTGGAREDDPSIQNSPVLGLPVVQRIFGATLLEEIDEGSD